MHPAATALHSLLLLPLLLLGGCGLAGALAYGDTVQTAVARGCWEGSARTPLPITVTPPGGRLPTTTPTIVDNPGAPTRTPAPSVTPLPSTTALPHCTPAPGMTLAPWPSPRPTQPPLSTRSADLRQPMVDGETIMRLPNALLALDLAVHPVQNWPVAAAVDIPVVNRDHARVFVRAYEPRGGGWGDAQSVDSAGSHPGERFRSVALGVTGDGTIHAVWGVTDFPELALFASASHDRGKHWSPPTRLGGGLFGVLDVATTLDNQVFVLAMQRDPQLAPVIFQRGADGRWGARETLPLPHVWYASGGALVVAGDGLPGVAPHPVALLTGDEAEPGTVYLLRRPLDGGPWIVSSRTVDGSEGGGLPGTARGLAYSWRQGQTVFPAVSFTFTMRDMASVFALTSLDGGDTWGEVETVARSGQASQGSSGTSIQSAAPAYDPVAQSLIAVWTCCQDGLWGNAAATHYASWRPLSRPTWSPELRPETFGQRIIKVRRSLPPPPSPTPPPRGPDGLERASATPDALENNYSPETAAPIGVGVVYELNFVCPVAGGCAGGDHDYLRFEAKADTRYLISTFDLAPGVDTVIDLFWWSTANGWQIVGRRKDQLAASPEQGEAATPDSEPVQERVRPPRRRRPTVTPRAGESLAATALVVDLPAVSDARELVTNGDLTVGADADADPPIPEEAVVMVAADAELSAPGEQVAAINEEETQGEALTEVQ